MATVLDLGLLSGFEPVFTFLLVLTVTYALLRYTNVFGKGASDGMYGLIAFSLAILSLFVPVASKIIANMAPWFVVIFFFIMFLLVAYKLFGVTDSEIADTIKAQGGIKWAIFIIGALIFLSALSSAYGPGLLPITQEDNAASTSDGPGSVDSGNFEQNVWATFFHPKIIGLLFVMLIGVSTVGMLGAKGNK